MITMAGWARASSACGLGDDAGLHHRVQHQAGALLGAQKVAPGEKTDGARVSVASIAAWAKLKLRALSAEIDVGRAIHAIGRRRDRCG